ncbi:MAG: arginine--tRNA ligase, partial [Victivallales bacterium]|nr:arginine--tRNA ligase [Victivallales bacterium]
MDFSFKCLAELTAFLRAEVSPTAIPEDWNIMPEKCPPEMTGDLTVNCFRFARILRGSPEIIADKVCAYLNAHPDVVSAEKIKAFVNITLKPQALYRDSLARLDALLADGATVAEKKRVLIEYSAPNTNKPQHLGHVRNNTLGMSLAALLTRTGHDVIQINLVNDRGIHICKSMLAYERFGNGITPESSGI